MRIRAKLTLMEMIVVTGFIIAISVLFYYSRVVMQLKNFEIQSQKILASLDLIELKASGLLTTNEDIFQLKKNLITEIATFNTGVGKIEHNKVVSYLPSKDQKKMKDLIQRWIKLYDIYYIPVFKLLDTIITTPHLTDFGNIGLLNIRNEMLKSKNISSVELAAFYQIESGVSALNQQTAEYANSGRAYMQLIKDIFDKAIQKSILLASLTGILSILLALIIIILFARRMGKRIILMHEAIQSVAEGDFSRTLVIKSKDEFEDFAKHYNTLMEELWSKLDSVLDFMKEIGGSISIGNLYTLDRILEIVIKSAVKNTRANAGAIFMISEEDETVIEKRTSMGFLPPIIEIPKNISQNKDRIKTYEDEHPFKPGETLIGESIINGESILIRDSGTSDKLPSNTDPSSLLFIQSMAIVPLVITGRVLGAIAIAKTVEQTYFTDIDFNHLKTFSDYAALTIDNMFNYQSLVDKSELYREIKIAADIQKNLLPVTIPDSRHLEFSAFSRAAKGVSGDYYDIFRLTKDKIAILICDVVGKGVPAALLMVMIRTIIRLVASSKRNAEQILTILNKGITNRVEVEQFATMSIIIFNENTGEVEYANAAHSPLLYYKKRIGKFTEIDAPGLPIGIESHEKYHQEIVTTEKGDILIFYTDGITEARNADHDEYSQFSLQRVIKNNAEAPTERIIELIKNDLANFVGLTPQHDDQTILIMKIK